MSIVKSFSVGNGDMFYIKHGTSNFTIIDCCLTDDNKKDIVDELKNKSNGKEIIRFISTHPDEDHIQKIDYLDNEMPIRNFYCVENAASKDDVTDGFKRYCELRDSDKAFFIYRGCTRKWMNNDGNDSNGKYIGEAGINMLWPKIDNEDYKEELKEAKDGNSPNNISPIIKYNIRDGVSFLWFGDLENSFMEKIKDEIDLPKINVLFAPHHGRKSGKVPKEWLEQMDPDIIVIGEASSVNLDYAAYDGYNKITQNSAENITFDCHDKKIHIYCSNQNYSVDFLDNEFMSSFNYYLGTLNT